jgi:hypothetical protein
MCLFRIHKSITSVSWIHSATLAQLSRCESHLIHAYHLLLLMIVCTSHSCGQATRVTLCLTEMIYCLTAWQLERRRVIYKRQFFFYQNLCEGAVATMHVKWAAVLSGLTGMSMAVPLMVQAWLYLMQHSYYALQLSRCMLKYHTSCCDAFSIQSWTETHVWLCSVIRYKTPHSVWCAC